MIAACGVPDESSNSVSIGIDELRFETVKIISLVVAVLAFVGYYAAVSLVDKNDVPRFVVLWGLLLAAGLTYYALRLGSRWAAGVFLLALSLDLTVALIVFQESKLLFWFFPIVIIAGTLLDWRGAVVAAVYASLLAVGGRLMSPPVPNDVAVQALLFAWVGCISYWLLSHPTRMALEWAWQHYTELLATTEELRRRQADLIELSDNLRRSFDLMMQLNRELERSRRSAEEARQAKSQFAAAVSHELRTPLNLILGFSEMMVLPGSTTYDDALPGPYREDIEAIYRNASHISALIDDILDLSQLDADRMALHKESARLDEIIWEAVQMISSLYRDKDLYLRVVVSDYLPTISVDRDRIRQIMINLLNNAARFTDRGGVTVTASKDGEQITVAVADTGVGIAADQMPRVFGQFQQVGGPARSRGGSGLGLAVSKRFTELHGGNMWVTSTVGQGSTFYLSLPLVGNIVASTSSSHSDALRSQRVRHLDRRSVLVMDEEGEAARVFERYLDGYEVLRSADLHNVNVNVVDSTQAVPAQAVILIPPSSKAQPVCTRELPPSLRSLPVVQCDLRTIRSLREDLHVFDYLVKPVSRTQLSHALCHLPRKPASLLIVDDDPDMIALLSKLVHTISEECKVAVANTGDQAIELLSSLRPDGVLLDLLMPDTDGYEVLGALRAVPGLRDVPVIIISGHGREQLTLSATSIVFTRDGGIGIGDAMRCIRGGLDALLCPPSSSA